VVIKSYSNNDYIGETSMILNAPRNADVIAETDMKVLVMDKYDFLYFIRGSEIARQMKIIAQNREFDTWSLFDASPMFKTLSPTQRTQLQGIMTRMRVSDGEVLAGQGTTREYFYMIDSGVVNVERAHKSVLKAGRGSLLAKIYATPRRGIHRFSLVAAGEVVYYSIDVMEFYRFLEKNPGVFLSLREARTRDTIQKA
jgi:CRP-like cAMP-binding protein